MAAYGLNASSKANAIPWDKAAFLARHPLTGPFLDEKRRVEFRSNCMRCLYLALDRPDIQFTAKEISRAMASLTVHADETLKAQRVLWREWTGKVWGLTDSNWAACPVICKSSSATLPHAGKTSFLRSQLNADDFKLVKRGSGVLRRCAVCLSNAGVEESHVGFVTGGQGRGRGAGKIRHIHCPALWLQHAVARRQIAITQRAGKKLSSRCRDQGGHPRRHHGQVGKRRLEDMATLRLHDPE